MIKLLDPGMVAVADYFLWDPLELMEELSGGLQIPHELTEN
jgi:hypothetical protein